MSKNFKNSKLNSNSLISIILPVYNTAEYLHECIDSILKQSDREFELIIVDDASTDASLSISREFARKDNRIKVYSNRINRGVSFSSNKAIKNARGRYIAVMNSDDVMHTDRLELQREFLENNHDHVLCGGQVRMINEHSEHVRDKDFPQTHEELMDMMYLANPIQHSSSIIDRSRLPGRFAWFDEDMNVSEDIDLLFKLQMYGKLANLPEVLIDYREHSESLSRQNPSRMYNLAYKARKRARKMYGYKTSPKNRAMLEIGLVVINLVPTKVVFPLFFKIRQILITFSKNEKNTKQRNYSLRNRWGTNPANRTS